MKQNLPNRNRSGEGTDERIRRALTRRAGNGQGVLSGLPQDDRIRASENRGGKQDEKMEVQKRLW